MTENKAVFITINVSDINLYHKDYEVVELFVECYTTTTLIPVTILGSPTNFPVAQTYATNKALMKLKRTQEILYGETK